MPINQIRIADICRTTIRFMFFRATREELVAVNSNWVFLGVGLLITCLVGFGRWWDNPEVTGVEKFGVGSVGYVIALSFYLWLIISPLSPKNWAYRRVLICVCMTAPPGFIYAIPVEWFATPEDAGLINLTFLTVVAVWRVALLFFILRRLGELSWLRTTVAALFPIDLVACVISFNTMFSVSLIRGMGGVRHITANQLAMESTARMVWAVVSLAFVPLFIAYSFFFVRWVYVHSKRLRQMRDEFSIESRNCPKD